MFNIKSGRKSLNAHFQFALKLKKRGQFTSKQILTCHHARFWWWDHCSTSSWGDEEIKSDITTKEVHCSSPPFDGCSWWCGRNWSFHVDQKQLGRSGSARSQTLTIRILRAFIFTKEKRKFRSSSTVDLSRCSWCCFAPSPQSEEDHHIDRIGVRDSEVYGVRMRRDLNDVVITPRTIALQPLLPDMHKVQRVLFAVTKLNQVNNHFHPFYISVDVDDKKWFFISEKTLRVYCIPGEKVPERYARNKDH